MTAVAATAMMNRYVLTAAGGQEIQRTQVCPERAKGMLASLIKQMLRASISHARRLGWNTHMYTHYVDTPALYQTPASGLTLSSARAQLLGRRTES